ncbi:MAG: SDR family NAD(P)-dependent oxidoreductase [Myxococcota bacterium]
MSKPVCAVIGIGPKNGAAFARRFAADGHAVALLSRRTEFSSQLAGELDTALALACDVTNPESVAASFTRIRDELGPVQTVIYNAGSGTWGNFEEISAEKFEQTWRVNSMGLFCVAKQVVPGMVEQGRGNIVVVGATASLRGKPVTTAFAPAKAAQRSLAQSMARHLGPKGIHVSLIIVDGLIGEAGASKDEAPDKLDPDDIAHAAAFLASQPRSAWTFELDVRPQLENW